MLIEKSSDKISPVSYVWACEKCNIFIVDVDLLRSFAYIGRFGTHSVRTVFAQCAHMLRTGCTQVAHRLRVFMCTLMYYSVIRVYNGPKGDL